MLALAPVDRLILALDVPEIDRGLELLRRLRGRRRVSPQNGHLDAEGPAGPNRGGRDWARRRLHHPLQRQWELPVCAGQPDRMDRHLSGACPAAPRAVGGQGVRRTATTAAAEPLRRWACGRAVHASPAYHHPAADREPFGCVEVIRRAAAQFTVKTAASRARGGVQGCGSERGTAHRDLRRTLRKAMVAAADRAVRPRASAPTRGVASSARRGEGADQRG